MSDYQPNYYIVELRIVNVRLLPGHILCNALGALYKMFANNRGAKNQLSNFGPVVYQLLVIYLLVAFTRSSCDIFARRSTSLTSSFNPCATRVPYST